MQTKKVAVNSKQDQIDFNGAKNIFVKLSSNKVNIMLFTVNKIIDSTFYLFPQDSEVSASKFKWENALQEDSLVVF